MKIPSKLVQRRKKPWNIKCDLQMLRYVTALMCKIVEPNVQQKRNEIIKNLANFCV